MCRGLVVFAGEKSLRSNYNIRHANLHEFFTFSDIKLMQFATLDRYKLMHYNINNYEYINTPMSS